MYNITYQYTTSTTRNATCVPSAIKSDSGGHNTHLDSIRGSLKMTDGRFAKITVSIKTQKKLDTQKKKNNNESIKINNRQPGLHSKFWRVRAT